MAAPNRLAFANEAQERKAQELMTILERMGSTGQAPIARMRTAPLEPPRERDDQPSDHVNGSPPVPFGLTGPLLWDEDALRAVLESVPDAVIADDIRGIILLVNRQTEELFGYPRADLLERPVEMLLPERFRARHVEQRERYFA